MSDPADEGIQPGPGRTPDAFGQGVHEARTHEEVRVRCPECGYPALTGGADGVAVTCSNCGREFQTEPAQEPGHDEQLYTGEPLETGDGVDVPAQQNMGPAARGGGEWPDPATPPQEPAPGAS